MIWRMFTVLIAVVAVQACAKTPESIAPAYVSHVQYQNWRCDQMIAESTRLQAAYTQVASQQSNARTNDVVGVILLGLPVSSLSGGNVAPQVAQVKGQMAAIHQAAAAKGCSLPAPVAPPKKIAKASDDPHKGF